MNFRIFFFLIIIALSSNSYAQWWVDGGNVIWPHGNVSITNGNLTLSGTFNPTGNMSLIGTLTVGVNDTGHDIKFFGATSGKYFLWDESADQMLVQGSATLDGSPINLGDFSDMNNGTLFTIDDASETITILASNVVIGQVTTFTHTTTFNKAPIFSAGYSSPTQTVIPNNTSSGQINALITSVTVGAVTNDANDWIILPALSSVPNGHRITILCSAGTNFELRTPTVSAEEINSEDCDGTKEYLCTDTEIVEVIKINDTIGWMAHGYSAIGAVVAAVVPD